MTPLRDAKVLGILTGVKTTVLTAVVAKSVATDVEETALPAVEEKPAATDVESTALAHTLIRIEIEIKLIPS